MDSETRLELLVPVLVLGLLGLIFLLFLVATEASWAHLLWMIPVAVAVAGLVWLWRRSSRPSSGREPNV
jgi:hypothetical protein